MVITLTIVVQGHDGGDGMPPAKSSSSAGGPALQAVGGTGATGVGGGHAAGGTTECQKTHGAATRVVTVAGLSCPCGGTHVGATRQLEGVRVTKVKAKKGTLRVSYSLSSASS